MAERWEFGGFVQRTFYYVSLVQYYFNQHTDIKGVQLHIFMRKNELNKQVELAGLGESVELGGFIPSTFYYFPLVQYYFNQHTDIKGVQ